MFYNKEANAFYLDRVSIEDIPEGSIEISTEEYRRLRGLAIKHQRIAVSDTGELSLEFIESASQFDKESAIREARDKKLNDYIDSISAVRLELMTDADKELVRQYRQALLDIPQQEGFPDSVIWPERPNV